MFSYADCGGALIIFYCRSQWGFCFMQTFARRFVGADKREMRYQLWLPRSATENGNLIFQERSGNAGELDEILLEETERFAGFALSQFRQIRIDFQFD